MIGDWTSTWAADWADVWYPAVKYYGEQSMDKPCLTLAEVNYLMRCTKKDTRLAKIVHKLTDSDDAFSIEVVFFNEPTANESEE